MSEELTDQACRLGQEILAADETSAVRTLDAALSKLIGPAFQVRPGLIVDYDGNKSESLAAVVYETNETTNDGDRGIPNDNVAAVVAYVDEMDVDSLRIAVGKIASTKRLRKHAIPFTSDTTNATLGLIFARRSKASLEALAEELYQLSGDMPHRHWPDMVAIASMGIVNYVGQFPGEMPSGDYIPHIASSFERGPAPVNILIAIRPTGVHTFNRFGAILIAHLQAFAPSRFDSLPDWNDLLDGVNPNAVTTHGFQFNVQGQLLPARGGHARHWSPRRRYGIKDKAGTVLAAIEYLKWQNGGAILLAGQLSLYELLEYLRVPGLRHASTLARQHYQLTNVLPISRRDFQIFLDNIHNYSPYVVDTEPEGAIIKKISDEGVQSPFVARCWLGLLRIRMHVYPDSEARKDFDKVLENVISSLMSVRTSSREIAVLWYGHAAQIASGEIVRLEGPDLHILKSVDKSLGHEVESFLNSATRTIKNGMQMLACRLGADIGFLFKKTSAFETGVVALGQTNPPLAAYIKEAREWTEKLVTLRNSLEHGLWSLPRATYTRTGKSVSVAEPEALNMPITKFSEYFCNRVCCFVEEVTAHCLQRKMLDGTTLTEVPLTDRPAEAPERFQVTSAIGGHAVWTIKHHLKVFDEV